MWYIFLLDRIKIRLPHVIGRVLKDEDVLSTYKIQTNHTIHMVKGVAKTPAASSSSTSQPLPTMQTGQAPSDPLTQLNTPMAHGLMAGFNPFAGMGVNTNDPNMVSHSTFRHSQC